MTDSGSSPFDFLQGYTTYASPPDPSQLAMPVPVLGYQDFDLDLESLLPALLPSTSFFETPCPRDFGTLISSSFPQDYSLPPVDFQSLLPPQQPISKSTPPIEPCQASQLNLPFTYGLPTYVNTQLTPPPGPPPPTFTPGLHYENFEPMAGQAYRRESMKRSAESELIRPAKKTNTKAQGPSGSYFWYDDHSTCKICGREFARQASLSQHQTVAHDGVRPFACEFHSCSKRFTTSSNAKRHTKTHYNR
ncbi:uncharacterized protein MELLADRAFT_94810 [Melampsora larici-populina 98AG31]|uniref:C2H2-type domain-containing protein n=1 Tax=Melampsora larici-populina (strain 98AG31 / pathotype 3-4-7) TaxID=747676 RepID=F4S804_MELLP|nr:uncharacterized protein MELLADRAFT_94810 [Melampsora larici-populina 98AG31]EGF99238.1 hypothetical protein MELLADRAFT_94810 [Melampsora larici-populina 98AG31]